MPKLGVTSHVYYEKLGSMLKLIVARFHSDLSVRLRDIAKKQVPVKLKPGVRSRGGAVPTPAPTPGY